MARTSPDGARHGGDSRPDDHGAARPPAPRPMLNPDKPYTAMIPDSSVQSVRKVARLDGRTRIIAGREPGGAWHRLHHRLRFTHDHVRELRAAGVSEVILKRGLKQASFPLAWLSNRRS